MKAGRNLPVVRAWRSSTLGFRVFVGAVAVYALMHLALTVVGPWQRLNMEHMHLRPGSYLGWALLHARPAMYNFENEYFLSPLPLDEKNIDDEGSPARKQAHHLWINHYPVQVPLWWYRQEMGKPGRRFYILLRTRFQGEEVISRWVLQSSAGGLRFVEVDW